MVKQIGAQVREEFPILGRKVNGTRLVYLDSGATAQRPKSVITAQYEFDTQINAAVSRGAHTLAGISTQAVEDARQVVANFIGAAEPAEIVWTKSTTESLNLLAYSVLQASILVDKHLDKIDNADLSLADLCLREGDNVVVTELEHHANLVPWQQICHLTGAQLRYLPANSDGQITLDLEVIDENTKWVAITAASNVTGAVTDISQIASYAKRVGNHGKGALVVLDACQLVAHQPVNVSNMPVDFLAFSGHKLYGPTGVGVLYGKIEILALLPTFLTGGSMVELVDMQSATFLPPPTKFEAGTLPTTQIVGIAKALEFVQSLGWENIIAHELQIGEKLLAGLQIIPGVKLLGSATMQDRLGIASFVLDSVHPHDVGQLIDANGVAVRTGHHCAQPAHKVFGVHSSTRASLGVYNTEEDIECFLEAIRGVRTFFGLDK